MTIWNKL